MPCLVLVRHGESDREEKRKDEIKRQISDNERVVDEFKKIREENYKDCNSEKNKICS